MTYHSTRPRHLDDEAVARLKNGDPEALAPLTRDLPETPMVLVIDPKKCTGCDLCRLACALQHTGAVDPVKSRIRVIQWEPENIYLPVACMQCSDAPCRSVCPKDAIDWHEPLGCMAIDYDRCVSCKMCVAACPFGAMGYDGEQRTVIKCNLCNGAPRCVPFCEPGALEFKPAGRLQQDGIRAHAAKLRR